MASFRIRREDTTALVTIDRPPANTITTEVFDEGVELLRRLATGDETRAVVLTGAGRMFSAGLDLFALLDLDQEGLRQFMRSFDEFFRTLLLFPKPLVAAINGHAIAGGCVVAAGADFRLMAAGQARIGLTELKVGVPLPATAQEIVHVAFAGRYLEEIALRGRTYEPDEALARGLIDEVVPAEELLPRATALAAELGSYHPPAFKATKLGLRASAAARLEAVAREGDPAWEVWLRSDTRAAMESFRARTLSR